MAPGTVMTHEEIQIKLNIFVKSSIELAWILGEVYEKKLYKSWGFPSYSKWIRQDTTGISAGYGYSLARIGRYLSPFKEEITEAVIRKNVSIRYLIDLISKVDQGLPLQVIVDHIVSDIPIPEEYLNIGKKTEPESPEPITFFIPRADFDQARLGLTLFCIRNNIQTEHEAIRMMCLDESMAPLPKEYKKWENVIFAGKFKCKLCDQIPKNPTHHHVIPRSILDGYGPVVILCWDCHEVVQPQWKIHAENWGFDIVSIAREYKQGLESGTIKDVDPEERYYDPERIS